MVSAGAGGVSAGLGGSGPAWLREGPEPVAIASGAVLPGPAGTSVQVPAEALRSHFGYYTVAAHFDPGTGGVMWGDRVLSVAEFVELLAGLPGWAEAVAEAGGVPKVIVVACGASYAPPAAYLAGAAGLLAGAAEAAGKDGSRVQVLGSAVPVVQHPGGDVSGKWMSHRAGQPARPLGPDLTQAIGQLAAEVQETSTVAKPAIALTPPQDPLTEPYTWAARAQSDEADVRMGDADGGPPADVGAPSGGGGGGAGFARLGPRGWTRVRSVGAAAGGGWGDAGVWSG